MPCAFQIAQTVHKDVAERLARINPTLAGEAKKVLERNKAERHIRGGQATLRKYQVQNAARKRCKRIRRLAH